MKPETVNKLKEYKVRNLTILVNVFVDVTFEDGKFVKATLNASPLDVQWHGDKGEIGFVYANLQDQYEYDSYLDTNVAVPLEEEVVKELTTLFNVNSVTEKVLEEV